MGLRTIILGDEILIRKNTKQSMTKATKTARKKDFLMSLNSGCYYYTLRVIVQAGD